MAVYKVPQDVEADDKLIGPFSFRQFIYLIVVAISGAGAWGLSTIFIPLAIIPLPFIVFFAALALPLRKDQPMETYLSAVVSFYFLKSRKRFWIPDGIDSFVKIIPPKDADKILTKQFGEDEAAKRLGYLSNLVDSHGWSVRGAGVPAPDSSVNNDLYYESQRANDVLDGATPQARNLTNKLQASTNAFHQNAIAGMQQAAGRPPMPGAQGMVPQRPPMPPAGPMRAPLGSTGRPTIAAPVPNNRFAPAAPFNPVPQPAPEPMAPNTQSLLKQESLDAITYASFLAEAAEDQRNGQAPQQQPIQPMSGLSNTQPGMSGNTSQPSAPDATMERARERAQELASRDDLTIATLSEEANRMEKRDHDLSVSDGEVTISLR